MSDTNGRNCALALGAKHLDLEVIQRHADKMNRRSQRIDRWIFSYVQRDQAGKTVVVGDRFGIILHHFARPPASLDRPIELAAVYHYGELLMNLHARVLRRADQFELLDLLRQVKERWPHSHFPSGGHWWEIAID